MENTTIKVYKDNYILDGKDLQNINYLVKLYTSLYPKCTEFDYSDGERLIPLNEVTQPQAANNEYINHLSSWANKNKERNNNSRYVIKNYIKRLKNKRLGNEE